MDWHILKAGETLEVGRMAVVISKRGKLRTGCVFTLNMDKSDSNYEKYNILLDTGNNENVRMEEVYMYAYYDIPTDMLSNVSMRKDGVLDRYMNGGKRWNQWTEQYE